MTHKISRPPSWHPIFLRAALVTFGLSSGAYAQTPAQCDIVYAVHDQGVQDSQIFTYNLTGDHFNSLGPLHVDSDLEGLDVHPHTRILYACSGQHEAQLYTIDALSGTLSLVGDIGFDNVFEV
jgi:uncharacterized protein YdaL